jgi:hypothetical protein
MNETRQMLPSEQYVAFGQCRSYSWRPPGNRDSTVEQRATTVKHSTMTANALPLYECRK